MSSARTRLTSVRTAIFPVAGLGTRFLPATKTTPKELLPVLDTPLIQYAIDEARNAGVERLVFVSHPSKAAIERHVMDDKALRETLQARGKSAVAEKLRANSFGSEDDVVFVMQDEPLGLGHAVLCARNHVLPGPVAVLLPDDLILGPKGCLGEMIEAYGRISAGHLVATAEVPRAENGILRCPRCKSSRRSGDECTRDCGEAIAGDGAVHHRCCWSICSGWLHLCRSCDPGTGRRRRDPAYRRHRTRYFAAWPGGLHVSRAPASTAVRKPACLRPRSTWRVRTPTAMRLLPSSTPRISLRPPKTGPRGAMPLRRLSKSA